MIALPDGKAELGVWRLGLGGRRAVAGALATAAQQRTQQRGCAGGDARKGRGGAVELTQGTLAATQAAIERRHGAGMPWIVILEPGAEHGGVDGSQPGHAQGAAQIGRASCRERV